MANTDLENIQKPFAYRDGDVVWGQGRVRHQNNSDYIQASDARLYRMGEWINQS